MKTIGILALQGSFSKHAEKVKAVGAVPVFVRTIEELQTCDALIIPGGESTTMSKLIADYNMYNDLLAFMKEKPVMGTCAGAILMSRDAHDKRVKTFGCIDMEVDRNAYGRQIASGHAMIHIDALETDIDGVFIRAPQFTSLGHDVKVLAEHNGQPVMVEQGNKIALAFHPELTNGQEVYEYFFDRIL